MAGYQSKEKQRRTTREVQAEFVCTEEREIGVRQAEEELNQESHDGENRRLGLHLCIGQENATNN